MIDISSQKIIINTRPAMQAQELTSLLQDNKFNVVELPLIQIEETFSDLNSNNYYKQISDSDLLIFISANAVIYFFKYFELDKEIPVAVIGKSTAKVFEQFSGRQADILPEKGSDSESLLKHPSLNGISIHYKRILIVRGQGGRELLAQQLTQRQAQVNYLEVYKRNCPTYKETYLYNLWHNIWHKNAIGFMIITSTQSLKNLLKITNKQIYPLVLEKNLLVIHDRIREKARQYGFSGKILVSKNASNKAVLQALLEL